jgi:predicted small lipoprotein YifL
LSLFRDRPLTRLALIGVALASLTLAGCGRKGPLDPPPAASVTGEPQASAPAAGASPMVSPFGGQAKTENPGSRTQPAGPNKHIFLDNLLN